MLSGRFNILSGQKLTVKQENSFVKKKIKWPFYRCENMDYLTLEGPGRQTVDSRSTSGVPLKSLGHDGSNEQVGGIKIERTAL